MQFDDFIKRSRYKYYYLLFSEEAENSRKEKFFL